MTDAATIAHFTPEGHFMCCICFEAFPLDDAYTDADGQRWDMCEADGVRDARMVLVREARDYLDRFAFNTGPGMVLMKRVVDELEIVVRSV